jgi:hypothetical protein
VVAGAPPSQFSFLYAFLKNSPFRHYLLMAAGGLNKAYGDKAAPLNAVLTPLGIKHMATSTRAARRMSCSSSRASTRRSW